MSKQHIFCELTGFPDIRINLYLYRGYHIHKGGRGTKHIETYPVRNFFRKLLGKPLLKPRRVGRWLSPYIRIYETSNSTYLYFSKGYDSMRKTERELQSIIDDFTCVNDDYNA